MNYIVIWSCYLLYVDIFKLENENPQDEIYFVFIAVIMVNLGRFILNSQLFVYLLRQRSIYMIWI